MFTVGRRLAAALAGSALVRRLLAAAAHGPRRAERAPLIEAIEQEAEFERQPDVGTFVHFVRR